MSRFDDPTRRDAGAGPEATRGATAPAWGHRPSAKSSASTPEATMDLSSDDLQAALTGGRDAAKITAATLPAPPRPDRPTAPQYASTAPAIGNDLVGRVLGGCRVEREIGRGAMGAVFEATHLSLQRRVAVKVLLPGARSDGLDVQQFIQEARALARIEHQNIVQVHDVGEDSGLHFLVMQLLDGGTVADRLERQGQFTWEEAARVARDAAHGLAVAHEKGIVHRDIKPENLMITTENVVKIADFGLAAKAARSGDPTVRSEVMGTPSYMPPEQIDGRNVDGRADIYSLGCTLYVMLTGRRPFEGESAIEVLLKQTKDTATPVVKVVPSTPPLLSQLVEKCMAKSPNARYRTAADLAADLEKILSGGRPKIVVEIEDVMSRMQEIARGEAAAQRGLAQRPAVVVSAAVALVCVTAIVMTIALPDLKATAADDFLAGAMPREATDETEARKALKAAQTFAGEHPTELDLVQRRYDELARQYGDELGVEIVAVRDKAKKDFEGLCLAEFAKVRAKSDESARAGDFVAALHALHAFPAELRAGKQGVEWTAEATKLQNQVRTSTGMAYVPAGRTASARDAAQGAELPAFLIDVFEVTNADYAAFVKAKGARAPAYWGADEPREAMARIPVVGVTPAEAAAYAAWKGKRLPSAAEWERAARGDKGTLYPWGDEFDRSRCVSRAAEKRVLHAVGTFQGGRSAFSVLDMAGNAAEWVADVSNDPLVGIGHEVRGGSAKSHPTACTALAKYFLPEDTQDPELLVGFRCSRNP